MERCPLDCCNCCSEMMICTCLGITEAELCRALTTLDLKSVRDIRINTGAGDGCTACHALLHQYLDEHTYASSAVPICSVK
jgi:bacterioferritin-associated ferredoxin